MSIGPEWRRRAGWASVRILRSYSAVVHDHASRVAVLQARAPPFVTHDHESRASGGCSAANLTPRCLRTPPGGRAGAGPYPRMAAHGTRTGGGPMVTAAKREWSPGDRRRRPLDIGHQACAERVTRNDASGPRGYSVETRRGSVDNFPLSCHSIIRPSLSRGAGASHPAGTLPAATSRQAPPPGRQPSIPRSIWECV
jgi:hypothetical protein